MTSYLVFDLFLWFSGKGRGSTVDMEFRVLFASFFFSADISTMLS